MRTVRNWRADEAVVVAAEEHHGEKGSGQTRFTWRLASVDGRRGLVLKGEDRQARALAMWKQRSWLHWERARTELVII